VTVCGRWLYCGIVITRDAILLGSESANSLIKVQAVIVMAGHSRPKDGVASARLCPAIHVLVPQRKEDVDAPGTSPGMTDAGNRYRWQTLVRKFVVVIFIVEDDPSLSDGRDGKTAANKPAGRLTIKNNL
jgi:hypothetical protein